MPHADDLLSAEWWPSQADGGRVLGAGGLWEMGAVVWGAKKELRVSQAGGLARLWQGCELPCANTVLSPLQWTQGPLSGQEKKPRDRAKQRPAGHVGHWLQSHSAPLNHNPYRAPRPTEAQIQVLMFSPTQARHGVCWSLSRPGPVGKRDASACGGLVGGRVYGRGLCGLQAPGRSWWSRRPLG